MLLLWTRGGYNGARRDAFPKLLAGNCQGQEFPKGSLWDEAMWGAGRRT